MNPILKTVLVAVGAAAVESKTGILKKTFGKVTGKRTTAKRKKATKRKK